MSTAAVARSDLRSVARRSPQAALVRVRGLRLLLAVLAGLVAQCLVTLVGVMPAAALKAIAVAEEERIELTEQGEFVDQRGDSIQIETAPGADGLAGRMGVRASAPGLSPNWIVFALRNTTDKTIERWVTAERYTVIGSGVVWPDLDTRRIEALTPSVGFLPERVKSDRADIFKISIEAGLTITYAAELSSDRFARVYLWKPLDYELKARDRQLFNGILLGITGVLGIFLTAVFAANHKPIFPSAALVTWCVLAYLCVDFGFWHKLFQLRPEDNAVYRAATEASMAASLLVFMYIFLRLTASHGLARMLLGVWMIAQLALIALAVIDARLAATFARASFAAIATFGMVTTSYLAARGQDRALSLLPTWILFLVWVFAAGMTLTGRLSGDIVVSSLVAGLVLITVLVGFTVTQFAFRSLEPMYGAAPSDQQLRSLAIDGSGAGVWEWNARREEIKTGPMLETALGLRPGELSSKLEDFCGHLHPADRERFRLLLWSVQERGGGDIRVDFRMRHADNSYRWFDLEAASAPTTDRRVLRCVGLVREITDMKRAHERMLHDAVHDSLTGLPNRELFIDRLGVAVTRAKTEPGLQPTVMLIDMDKFKNINAALGLIVGDSLLLTLARRLQRHLEPQDTLARVGGNQFALLLLHQRAPSELPHYAERVRRSLRSPVKIGGQEIVLTGSIGVAIHDEQIGTADEFFKDAEIAMYRAKRGGADRIEIYRAEFRNEADERAIVEMDLANAIEKKQLSVLYQPIISLATEELAGFEALVRWQHPKLGLLSPNDFVPVAEQSDLINKLGSFVLARAVEDAAEWQKLLPRADRPLFISVNISSRQLLRQDLVAEIRNAIGRTMLPAGALRLEITESLVMENPERSIEVLEGLRSAGAGLSLDDFGTGYSSLSYVQRFPFDTIKIDRDLVQSSGNDGTGSVIVRSIVAMAHELGKKVVAEGVEAESDVGFLRSIGCEYAQGFYYGEPMVDRDVVKMLKVIGKTEHRSQRAGFFRTTAKRTRRPERSVRPKSQPRPVEVNGVNAATVNAANPAIGVAAAGQNQGKNGGRRTRSRIVAGAGRGRPPAQASVPQPAEAASFNGHQSPAMAVQGGQGGIPATMPPAEYAHVQINGNGMVNGHHVPPIETGPENYPDGHYANGSAPPPGYASPPPYMPPVHEMSPPPGLPPGTDAARAVAMLQDIASRVVRDTGVNGDAPPEPAHAYNNGAGDQAWQPPSAPPMPRQSPPPPRAPRPAPDLSTLPPAIAASLAKLAKGPARADASVADATPPGRRDDTRR